MRRMNALRYPALLERLERQQDENARLRQENNLSASPRRSQDGSRAPPHARSRPSHHSDDGLPSEDVSSLSDASSSSDDSTSGDEEYLDEDG
jgi:hypothetical protein